MIHFSHGKYSWKYLEDCHCTWVADPLGQEHIHTFLTGRELKACTAFLHWFLCGSSPFFSSSTPSGCSSTFLPCPNGKMERWLTPKALCESGKDTYWDATLAALSSFLILLSTVHSHLITFTRSDIIYQATWHFSQSEYLLLLNPIDSQTNSN